jgi:hypothetical protein
MATSKLNMGWTGVTFTPTGGSALVIDEVTDVQLGKGGSAVKFFGDNNAFTSLLVVRAKSRAITITTGNSGAVAALAEGVEGTVVAIFNDAKNGTGAGAITITLASCVLVGTPIGGGANEFGKATLTFESYSAAGTDPLTIAIA